MTCSSTSHRFWGVTFEELHEGDIVEYEVGHGPKGPRAENMRLVGP